MNSLACSPVNWASVKDLPYKTTMEPLKELLDTFDVEFFDDSANNEVEVDRGCFKSMYLDLVSGDFSDTQDEAYQRVLKEWELAPDAFLSALNAILNVRTDYIRIGLL